MKAINPYLNFNGDAEEAFNFYKSVFGGEFAAFARYKDVPELPSSEKSSGNEKLSESDLQKIMHVSLPIGKGNVLMASDVLESCGHSRATGNNCYICVETESENEAERVFAALSAGGKVSMPLAKTFWGAYFGMFTDKFGIHWMINFTYPQ